MPRKVVPRASSEQTREKILAVSERLFAASGYDGVSLRQIGMQCEIPFALVTYHFLNKLGLYKAVFSRRIVEFTNQRSALLQRVTIEPDVYRTFLSIAAAFIGPMIKLREMPNGEQFAKLLAREIFDPNEAERGVVAEHLDPLARMTMELLHRVAPAASRAEISEAYHFATGALAVNHAGSDRLKRISGLGDQHIDSGKVTDQLVRFIAAGLLAALRPDVLTEKKLSASIPGEQRVALIGKAKPKAGKAPLEKTSSKVKSRASPRA